MKPFLKNNRYGNRLNTILYSRIKNLNFPLQAQNIFSPPENTGWNELKHFWLVCADKNNLELDVDIAGDLATLKENLAKFKKGKMKGLEDIDINELDWVRLL